MNLHPDIIINHCLSFYDQPREKVFSKSLKQEYVFPRQMTQRMIKKFSDMTYSKIARTFDSTNCTIKVNCAKIDRLFDVDRKVKRDFIQLSNQLEEML